MNNPHESERHVIFGTAGHVDHGKSALVLALTGTDPDRLAEEKAREMTIDLGFAFLPLPGIKNLVAIVDVPGHEMFVRNMVAGATGVDAAIFVVAADEGVMPQTVEHLDALRYLNLPDGVVALTKSDKAAPERINNATAEIRELTRGTFLETACILPVSAVSGEGLSALREELGRIAARVKARPADGPFRQPIDRVFTLKGVGTVITGTVISGSLRAGDTVVLLPQGRELRARNLQVHNESVKEIFAGQRAAVNLADAAKDHLHRGDVLATPGSLAPSLMVDARLHYASSAPRPLEQRTRVRVHHGTREVMARVVLLEGDQLKRGESALVQLRLESPLVPSAGDLFVVRSYSPMRVVGGGTIVDAHPPKRQRTSGAEEVAKREKLPVDEVIESALDHAGARGMDAERLCVRVGLSAPALRSLLDDLQAQGRTYAGRRNLWFSAGAIEEMQSAIVTCLAQQHGKDPLRSFVSLNAVVAAAAGSSDRRECCRIALDALKAQGTVVASGGRLRLSSHKPQWAGRAAQARERILARCRDSGLAAPSMQELAAASGSDKKECERVLLALVDSGELRLLAKGIHVHPEVFTHCRERVRGFLEQNGKMTVAQCRELLAASRKYLLPFLEELDREGLTLRQGDYRVLR